MKPSSDINRLREEYKQRKDRFTHSDVYSWSNIANLFAIQSRQRAVLAALKKHGLSNFVNLHVLDVGCGEGGVIREFLAFGVPLCNLWGVDLLPERLLCASQSLPGSNFINGDGQSLPFPSQTFDLVIQFTALSSILDANIRQNICGEMMRVLKKNGLILSYDFWINPTNPQTHAIHPNEICDLFPDCRFEFKRVTLAPPIARRLVPVSWQLSALLEKMVLFNSHYLSAIQRS